VNPWMMLALGVVLGAGAMAFFRRPRSTQAQAPDKLQALREQWRKTRHDVRGALSPAMLTADRLSGHQDPAIGKAGSLIMVSLNRALEMLQDPEREQSQPAPASRVEKTTT
jgi:hypothetical protein